MRRADCRFLSIPLRPEGTEGWSEEKLQALVTRDSIIGVSIPMIHAVMPHTVLPIIHPAAQAFALGQHLQDVPPAMHRRITGADQCHDLIDQHWLLALCAAGLLAGASLGTGVADGSQASCSSGSTSTVAASANKDCIFRWHCPRPLPSWRRTAASSSLQALDTWASSSTNKRSPNPLPQVSAGSRSLLLTGCACCAQHRLLHVQLHLDQPGVACQVLTASLTAAGTCTSSALSLLQASRTDPVTGILTFLSPLTGHC